MDFGELLKIQGELKLLYLQERRKRKLEKNRAEKAREKERNKKP